MFQSLERRASRALSDICGENVSSRLIPNDAGYLGFFLRVMERLEAGATKALALAEEKSRDLLSQEASDVFNHLLCLDRDFDFTAVLDPVPETIRAALAEWVEVHMEDLVARIAPEGPCVGSGDDASPLIHHLALLIGLRTKFNNNFDVYGPGPAHFPAVVRHNLLPRLSPTGLGPDALGADMGGTWVAEWPCNR
ncbi:hypothetical protein D1007_57129 [Hordeum vulgare]|nr:hypothetical protein D1007_57129 [Hordeum vulgare]